jgi:hypothetical protein
MARLSESSDQPPLVVTDSSSRSGFLRIAESGRGGCVRRGRDGELRPYDVAAEGEGRSKDGDVVEGPTRMNPGP